MLSVTNNTTQTLDFVVGVKNGAAVTDHIEPGETKSLDVNPDDPVVQGRVISGAITIAAVAKRSAPAKSEG